MQGNSKRALGKRYLEPGGKIYAKTHYELKAVI